MHKPVRTVEVIRTTRVIDTTVVHDTTYIDTGSVFTNIVLIRSDTNDTTGAVSHFYPVKDSILDGWITVFSRGMPDSVDFEYKATLPRFKETVTIHDSTYVEKLIKQSPTSALYVGGGFSLDPIMSSLSVHADYITKKGWMCGYFYQRNNNYKGTHNIKIGKIIRFKRPKGLH